MQSPSNVMDSVAILVPEKAAKVSDALHSPFFALLPPCGTVELAAPVYLVDQFYCMNPALCTS